jgi:hypothetical protein
MCIVGVIGDLFGLSCGDGNGGGSGGGGSGGGGTDGGGGRALLTDMPRLGQLLD